MSTMLATSRRRANRLAGHLPDEIHRPSPPHGAWHHLAAGYGLSAALILIAILAKGSLLPWTGANPAEIARWSLRLSVVAAADIRFAALAGALFTVMLALAPRSRVVRASISTAATGIALYSVAGVAMFRLLMVPLTVPLLSFAGGPMLMASSLAMFFTPTWCAVMCGAVCVTLAARQGFCRRAESLWLKPLLQVRVAGGLLSLILVYASVCHGYVAKNWTDPNRWERRIAQSPHAALLGSAAAALRRGEVLSLDFSPAQVDESDFEDTVTATDNRDAPGVSAIPGNPSQPLNLVVIVLESVGVRHLGIHGSRHDTTPHLDRLAAERGVIFENCYAHAPSSPKGLVALTASVIPGVDWKLITRDAPEFSVPTLPQVLRQNGYRTCYAHSGYWSWKQRDRFLRERGVQDVLDATTLADRQVFSWGMSDDRLFQAGLDWIQKAPREPFHLLLWTIETHHPYVAGPSPVDFASGDEELERYLNALRRVDERIGRFVAELERLGLAESTMIAVTGDHGEAFGEHGQRVHSFGVYEENVHAPLVLLLPRDMAQTARFKGNRVEQVCQQIDVSPTLLGLLGLGAPDAWQGRDLFSESQGSGRVYFYSTGNEVLLGLREGPWKYHLAVGSGREELFDVTSDPNELHNLAIREPRRSAEYRARVGGLVTYQRRFLQRHGVQ